jgi:hypothetical protein
MRARETLQAVSRWKRVGSFCAFFCVRIKAAGRQVCFSNLEVLLSTKLEYRSFITELWLCGKVLLRVRDKCVAESIQISERAG